MNILKKHEIAQALYRVRGNRAELEAAQKERAFEAAGNRSEALNWRAIRESIRQARGANQS